MADEQKRKNPAATFYKPGLLNKWFMISSVVLALSYVWSIYDDYNRPWKQYQRDFMALEFEMTQRARDAEWQEAGGRSVSEELEELQAKAERQQSFLDSDAEERPKLVAAVSDANFEYNVTNAEMKSAKAIFEAERYHYEELVHLEHDDLWNPQKESVKEALAHYLDLKEKYEVLADADKVAETKRNEMVAQLDTYDSQIARVESEFADLDREMDRLERKMLKVDPERIFSSFRNSVFFDFMAPSLTVNKIVVKEVQDELNFLQVPKIDMCTTCHLGIASYRDYPHDSPMFHGEDPYFGDTVVDAVFQAHPRPELFVTSLSPHDMEIFGCSACHSGGNQRVNFKDSAHTPQNADQKSEWKEKYHWKKMKYWDYPQLPANYLEASCYKCHADQVEIPGADTWNRGRQLVERYGCFGCHKMEPFEDHRKSGPPLYHMADKFQSVDWTMKWVEDPRSFRPTTRMPSFFHLENRQDDPERQRAEIAALVTYLYNQTSALPLERTYPGNGDAERGRALFGDNGGVGCLACHNIDDYAIDDFDERHGPDLSGVGSKLREDWLYNWLLDPQSIWEDTNMPNLRLTDQEAADLVAYLMTKRNGQFESMVFESPADDGIYEDIVREKLVEKMTEGRANELIASMSPLDKRLRAGEALLNHYGCFGCHMIEGYQDAKQIGTELNGWGSKHPDRLDFGMAEMDWKHNGKFNRIAWLDQKLRNTRFYDRGKDKGEFEKLKMPQFRFPEDPEDLHALMTFVLGMTKDHVDESIQRKLSPSEDAVERGRQLVKDKNCLGCHMMYDMGGEIRQFQVAIAGGDADAARAYFPPLLDGQGARTQPEWLFNFLTDPSMGAGAGSKAHLRPWMSARMPTFGFNQQELNDLIAYFAHEETWHTANDPAKWDALAEEFRSKFDGYDNRGMKEGGAEKRQLYDALLARNYRDSGGTFLHQTDYPYLSQLEWELGDERHEMARRFFTSPQLNCIQCHMPGGIIPEGKTAADMAPVLNLAKNRLQPNWVKRWLEGPGRYQPGTKMPSLWAEENGVREPIHDKLQDAHEEMYLIRDYLFSEPFAEDYEAAAR